MTKTKKLVAKVRAAQHKADKEYHAWTVAARKARYGRNASAVRKQLVPIVFCGRKVMVHKKVKKNLLSVAQQIRLHEHDHGYERWVPSTIECFNWRVIRGGSSLSRHAHAIALDIDHGDNPSYARYQATKSQTTHPAYVVQAFRDHRWKWGGEWDQPCDTMHFQIH